MGELWQKASDNTLCVITVCECVCVCTAPDVCHSQADYSGVGVMNGSTAVVSSFYLNEWRVATLTVSKNVLRFKASARVLVAAVLEACGQEHKRAPGD